MNEDQFLREVISVAHDHGVLVHHCYDSRKCYMGGLPDLVLVGKNSILFAELKTDYTDLSTSQVLWKYRITAARGQHVVWHPGDLDHIEAVLCEL